MKTIVNSNAWLIPSRTVTRSRQVVKGEQVTVVTVRKHTSMVAAATAVAFALFGLAVVVALLIKLN